MSALHVANYEPEDEKHLGYLLLPGEPADPAKQKMTPRPEAVLSAALRMAAEIVDGVARPSD